VSAAVSASLLGFGDAVDRAVEQAMARDPSVVVLGEDVPMIRRGLLARFGPGRVRGTPISESAFLGAGVGAAMAGLRPVVEIMLIDFLAVALSALQNEAAMIPVLSGGRWDVPLVVRATCGGGYGDGGQHEQALWGRLAAIPGLTVVVPSTPADAAGLMRSAIESDGPVVFLEHKLLSSMWLEWMGGSRRPGVSFDVPPDGAEGPVDEVVEALPFGSAAIRRHGSDVALVSLGVGAHRCAEAADRLAADHGIDAAVLDLRTVAPLDVESVRTLARDTGQVLVVDEDHVGFGLTGEVAAVIAEAGIDARFARLATSGTIPYARALEDTVLPGVDGIVASTLDLVS